MNKMLLVCIILFVSHVTSIKGNNYECSSGSSSSSGEWSTSWGELVAIPISLVFLISLPLLTAIVILAICLRKKNKIIASYNGINSGIPSNNTPDDRRKLFNRNNNANGSGYNTNCTNNNYTPAATNNQSYIPL